MPRLSKYFVCLMLLTFVCACSDGTGPDGAGSDDAGWSDTDAGDPGWGDADPGLTDPGAAVDPSASETQDQLLQAYQSAASVTTADFLSEHEVGFGGSIGYDPTQAQNLDLIQATGFALDQAELDKLRTNGFVIPAAHDFPTFAYGYHSIYREDLPVYITADAILFALHRSYDAILKRSEISGLIPAVRTLLESMRDKLADSPPQGFDAQVYQDADMYLAVALSLLEGEAVAPVAGAPAQQIESFVDQAMAHQGRVQLELFGARRHIDFSQFKPRGHYTDSPELERYFRAMIWLGRIDLRFLEATPTGELLFHRNQVEIAVLLHGLLDQQAVARWEAIDKVIGAFVGEQDNMSVDKLAPMLEDLNVTTPAELAQLDDETIAKSIQKHGHGKQRIMSHIMFNGMEQGSLPLSASFLLFGQRYVPDSHVLANVVYDRVKDGAVKRMMPDPLDAAFGALANDHAAELLTSQLQEYDYAGDLNAMRVLIDQHGEAFWDQNLYNRWLSALRELSPGQEVQDPGANGLPQITGTEPWARRMLNTQLASWAELRHDTILYTKQSYTSGDACEFPDAYVDPYPQFYAELTDLARHGQQLADVLEPVVTDTYTVERITSYFEKFATVSEALGAMAEQQRAGTPFTQAQMDFVNEMVVIESVCGGDQATGWYAGLFFAGDATDYDPTIADIHTQPTEAGGNEVGRVLHVATGSPRMMVVTTDTCDGPRAYAAVVSSYFEKTTEDYLRLNDMEWKDELVGIGAPADVDWMSDLIVR